MYWGEPERNSMIHMVQMVHCRAVKLQLIQPLYLDCYSEWYHFVTIVFTQCILCQDLTKNPKENFIYNNQCILKKKLTKREESIEIRIHIFYILDNIPIFC